MSSRQGYRALSEEHYDVEAPAGVLEGGSQGKRKEEHARKTGWRRMKRDRNGGK